MKISFWPLTRSATVSNKNILDLLIEFDYLAIVFLVPLWLAYWFPTHNVFEFNKLIIFKILVYWLLFFTFLKIIFYESRLTWSPLIFFKKYWLVPAIFIIGLSFTLLNSLNPTLSFYGIMERQAGLASYLFYFLWFILVSFNVLTINNQAVSSLSNYNDRVGQNLKRLVVTLVFSASLVSLYGLLQILNIDFLIWPEAPWLTHRIFSTFGQPNFLASWLLLVIPLSLYLFLISRRVLTKFACLLMFSVQLIALFLTGSRGGLLALLFVSALFLIYLLSRASWSRFRKYLVILFFVILSFSSLWVLDYYSHGRVRQLADFSQGSSGVRLNIYQAASEAIKARPLWGYGLENEGDIFIKYYLPDWGVYGNVGQSADRAHNLILDILLSTGVYGLILFSLYYYFFFNLVRDNLKNNWQRSLTLALGLGAIGYLISLLFNFTVVAAEVYFWLFLALLVIINFIGRGGLEVEKTSLKLENFKNKKLNVKILFKIITALILVIFIFWQINRTLKILIADYYVGEIYLALAKPDYPTALVLDGYFLSCRPDRVAQESYYLFLGDRLSESFSNSVDLSTQVAIKQKLKEVDLFLTEQSYKSLLVKAKINLALHNFFQADAYLSQIIKRTPHWPLVYLEQGKSSFVQGDFKTALINYYLASLNLPNPDDARLNEEHRQNVLNYQYFISKQIANIYEVQKNYIAAEKYYQLAYRYNSADFTLLKKIADTYYLRGDLNTAIEYTQRGLIRNPSDYRWSLALAVLFDASHDKKSASNYLNEALKLAPQNEELLELQKKINQ
ncbi:MAG: O-antigen ligase family protein [Patescibacteria group bacterium]|jgi:putative inorganic carbon (HCO3(-)) transporter